MIKGIGITVIIDEIKKEDTTAVIRNALLNILPKHTQLQSVEKYTKFVDAYKLEFGISITDTFTKEKLIYQLLLHADSIARPWSVYFDNDGNNTELIFNRDSNTQIMQPVFSHIRWAHIQLIY